MKSGERSLPAPRVPSDTVSIYAIHSSNKRKSQKGYAISCPVSSRPRVAFTRRCANGSLLCLHELHERPIVANPSLSLDATVKAPRIRMEPVAPYSHNMMPMPYHPATSKIEGVSSLEAVMKVFWDSQRDQLENFTGLNRQNHLPVSRVKKILKSDPRVTMISRDAPALFSKACEFFILELTLRAWMHTQSCSRQTMRRCDIFQAVKNSETYGFLIDLVPFGQHCAIHQGVLEHAEPEKVLPPAEMILPDMNVPIDMNEVEQENLIAERSIIHKGFDLNSISSEHDSAGSYSARET